MSPQKARPETAVEVRRKEGPKRSGRTSWLREGGFPSLQGRPSDGQRFHLGGGGLDILYGDSHLGLQGCLFVLLTWKTGWGLAAQGRSAMGTNPPLPWDPQCFLTTLGKAIHS